MFDVWLDEMDLTLLVWGISLFVVFPLQLFLCAKVKPLIVRILPVLLFGAATVILALMAVTAEGWDILGYIVLAAYAGIMLLMCGVGWGTWAIVRWVRKRCG